MSTAPQNSGPVKSRARIGICGAGPAGLAAALSLDRIGLTPIVFERRNAQQLVEEGAFLTLAPNGMNALAVLGLAGEVESLGMMMSGLQLFNEAGALLHTVDYGPHRARYGAPSVTIGRGQLNAVLLHACQAAGIAIHLDTRVIAARPAADGVVVTTEAGEDRFDALLACDGLHSPIRRRLFPELPKPHYSGLVGGGGLVEAPDIPATGGHMRMIFGQSGFFGYMKAEGRPVHWFNSYAAAESAPGPVDDPRAYAGFIAELHRRDPLDVPAIVSRIDHLERHYPIYDLPTLPHWSHGRVLLLGDAAHAVAPHSGQGASLALEDAVVLAAILERSETFAAAFARFEAARRDRARKALISGRLSGSSKMPTGWLARKMRDLALPLFMPLAERKQAELFDFRVDLAPA